MQLYGYRDTRAYILDLASRNFAKELIVDFTKYFLGEREFLIFLHHSVEKTRDSLPPKKLVWLKSRTFRVSRDARLIALSLARLLRDCETNFTLKTTEISIIG